MSRPTPSASVAELLWRAADQAPDAPAVIEGDRSVSWRELRDRAAGWAAMLQDGGLAAPGRQVALFAPRGAEAAAAYFGALATGAAVVIVNERLRPRQIEYILQHADVAALVASRELLSRQPRPLDTAVPVLDADAPPAPVADSPAAREAAPGDRAQIIYTSGSTGMPKGVVFSHGAVRRAIDVVVGYLGLRADDRLAALMPFSSVYGLNQLLCATACGGAIVVDHSPVPAQLVSTLRRHRVSVLAAVPPLWSQLLQVPSFRDAPLPDLRVLQNAGGHLPVDVVRRVRAAQPHARLFLQYGMTETFRGTFLPPEEVDARPGSMGRPMPTADIRVLRDDGTPCDVDEVGELVHAGPTLADGYWKDPATTAAVFRPLPGEDAGTRAVFSGDLVRRDAEGFLHYVSRRDRIIKTLGFRVGPDEIADVLHASGEILEAVVTTEADAARGDRIVAFVVLAPGGDAVRLQRFCGVELPRHMQPGRIAVVDALPRLPSGKYDVAALRGIGGESAPAEGATPAATRAATATPG